MWWFTKEDPIKIDDLGVPLFQEPPVVHGRIIPRAKVAVIKQK